MLSIASVAFACAAIAFASQRRPLAALACAALGWGAAVEALGFVAGSVATLAAWMAAASVLVLLVPQRPQRARGVALASSAVGVLSAALALAIGTAP